MRIQVPSAGASGFQDGSIGCSVGYIRTEKRRETGEKWSYWKICQREEGFCKKGKALLAAVCIAGTDGSVPADILLPAYAGYPNRISGLYGSRRHLGKRMGRMETFSEIFFLPPI